MKRSCNILFVKYCSSLEYTLNTTISRHFTRGTLAKKKFTTDQSNSKFKYWPASALTLLAVEFLRRTFVQRKNNEEQQNFFVQQYHAEQDTQETKVPIYRIVLTGGPCGGKSSAMTRLSERLQALGFQVFIVTEIATLLLTGGARFNPDMTFEQLITFETALMKTQMSLEDSFHAIAQASGKPTVLLCDRGVMDPSAYLDDYTWDALLSTNGWSVPKLRDSRYDCIIHLVTAAIGAEKYYTLANNLARSETLEQAQKLDIKLREAYVGHSDVHFIDNSTGFEDKIQRVLDVVSHRIGFPRPINYRRRFLLKDVDGTIPIQGPYQEVAIEQVFLKGDDPREVKRIVKRGQSGVFNYTLHNLTISRDGQEETVVARPITAKTYVTLMGQRDPNRVPIQKRIRTFVYNEYYLEIHSYLSPHHGQGVHVLQVEIDPKRNIEVNKIVPPFLQTRVEREVTNDIEYSSFGFSKKKFGE